MFLVVIRWIVLVSLLAFVPMTQARTFDLPYDMHLDIRGYLGWKQIISNVKYDSIPSEPELGITSSLAITDRLVLFNQFKYGTSLDDVTIYNQLSYAPDIPIDDFQLTINGGKIRYDNTLYNITRINPRTRQGVFQPQSLYWNTLGQTITSGLGVGVDVKYKNWSGSYVIDKQTIVNAQEDAEAWTTGHIENMTSKFGGHQMVSMQYEIPEYELRFKTSWNKSKFSIPVGNAAIIGVPTANTIGIEYVTVGAELIYDKWIMSLEGQSSKRDGANWSHFDELAYGGSATVEYDLTDNFTLRANYNAYESAAKVIFPQGKYNRDVNIGINWHKGNWMAGVEGHYIQGGRIVAPKNYNNNPNDYKQFYVIGMNLVYFWD